ncbi:hypothetical protein BD626DRAFT_576240 [Schizophyllum amplum]|uniref:DUF6533 domain-containing protein n=1 Tax=Schizophyllum amplum TaxID=97359 RepID=A0A550BTU3_9AGAR|nr:hypothetical protein BD626DRAFT_576240 [Auriculariopsis ampla]
MSGPVDQDTVSQSLFVNSALQIAGISAVLLYDYIITLGPEIEYIWRRPKRLSSHIFFVFRYFGVLGGFFAVASNLWEVPPECRRKCPSFALRLLAIIYATQMHTSSLRPPVLRWRNSHCCLRLDDAARLCNIRA